MNPYSIHQALLAKHGQHVVLIHFPIGLFMAGVAFDFGAYWTGRRALSVTAYYNFLVAALSTPLVVATGLIAWQFQLEGQKLKGILLQHLMLGVASSLVICIVWYAHFRLRRTPQQTLPTYRLPIECLATVLLALTAHLGGYLSGVNIPS